MSASILWIFLPILAGAFLLFLRNQRWTAFVASGLSFVLALTAWLLPIETTFALGSSAFKLSSTFEILGRRLVLTTHEQPILTLIYGAAAFWFIASPSIGKAHRLIPLGLVQIGLLVAALAVEPFLYAALLIEVAVLLTPPLLLSEGERPGRGLLRFVTFQTLAMPLILFTGWLLRGIEADPGASALIRQAAILLATGFVFLLAVFPFHTWIPLLSEEAAPYLTGFVFWIFPTSALLFAAGFIDRYAWIRTAPQLPQILSAVGALMVAAGGLLAVFQNHLGRMLGYAVILETGFSLLSLSLLDAQGVDIFFLLFVPRLIALALWALCLDILHQNTPSLTLQDLRGQLRRWPFASGGLILAHLSLAGLPTLAGFPIRLAIWEDLATLSLPLAAWALIGSLGLLAAAIRTLAALVAAPAESTWEARESWPQRLFIALGGLALFGLGAFPQWILPLLNRLPAIFEHLGG
ncbi:MAG: proton-conducting transporter membrane subunit [Anaerolineales bacterium]